MKEGVRYVVKSPTVLALMLLVGTISLFGMSFATLMPAWAVRILGGDATTNGLLQSARGLGALLSAFAIASLGRFTFKGKLLTVSTFVLPVMLLVFSQTRWLPLSLLALVGVGMSHIPILNIGNALVQTQVPDALRGRVMSVWQLVFMGMMPLGGMWAGAVAEHTSEPVTIVVGAVIVLSAAVFIYVFAPRVRAAQ